MTHAEQLPLGNVPAGEPSLEEVVRLLGVARRFFGVAGTMFLLWKIDEVLGKKKQPTIADAVVEVGLVSVLGPGARVVRQQVERARGEGGEPEPREARAS